MLPKNDPIVIKLLSLLEKECVLQEQYLTTLALERAALTSFKTKDISSHSEKRAALNIQILEEQKKRRTLILSYPEGCTKEVRLTEWASGYCHTDDARKIVKLGDKLRALIEQNRKAAGEFGTVLDFSMGMVSSTLSIIWSASQNVTDTYSSAGKLQKHFLPLNKPQMGLLKQA